MHKPIFLCGRMTVISILGRKIDLPTSIFLHGLGLALYGLYMAFYPLGPERSRSKERASMIGFTMTALGLGYLGTAYMPQEQNAFLYLSVPIRMGLGLLCGLKLWLSGKNISAAGKIDFLLVLIYDGIGGFLLGWSLGTWSGIAPAYRI